MPKFPISSDQLELLLLFRKHPSLQKISDLLRRDPSVVSRNLQRLAETMPVIVKTKGRWEITELGQSICDQTTAFLDKLAEIIAAQDSQD